MKATGVVRRIDDLGRIVVPKEVRRTMRIKEGESLEIFVDGTDKIVLERYKYGEKISQDIVIYEITAEKISGDSALSILKEWNKIRFCFVKWKNKRRIICWIW